MQIQRIVGENGVLPHLCNNAACPAAILTAEGDVFVQGYLPNEQQAQALTAPPGEGFVRMSKETFQRIVQQL